MGYCPDWYDLIQAAKYLGVAPWDLLAQPRIWHKWARDAENAEATARQEIERREKRRQGTR